MAILHGKQGLLCDKALFALSVLDLYYPRVHLVVSLRTSDKFNTLPNDKILDLSKLNAFEDEKLNVSTKTDHPL